MSARLQGKRALVTAAAQGIGRATALAFAHEGAEVLATDLNLVGLGSLQAEQANIRTAPLDVTDPQAIRAALDQQVFDIVFNCAGWVHHGSIEECDETAWRRSFDINVDSMYRVCRNVIPGMMKAGGGSIINMSSVASSVKGATQRFAYGASKAAVIGLSKSIAADYACHRVRCNAICPGTVLTPSLGERVAALKTPQRTEDDVWKTFVSRQPLGRLGDPKEIAALAVHLAGDESAFTTGAVFVIDGGWSN
jgi:2-keto-3-deoxy-L-fuconate dehydrogenase